MRLWFLAALLSLGTAAQAQIDPHERQLLQLGYNQPLEGRGPTAGYAYYYLNHPQFVQTNLTLRLAIAPIYLDSELGIHQAFGPRTDVAVGIAGGGFADSYSEVRGGSYLREESFTGHGGEVSTSVYHLFNPGDKIPLYGVMRASVHDSVFERDNRTLPNFTLPDDQVSFHFRSGLRLGGREPLIMPDLAMELSAWYEGQVRTRAGSYGLAGDRRLEVSSHLFWGRAMLIYTMEEWKHTFSVSVTGGGAISPDRFSAYRLGSVLPLASEFPLNLPGYYFQEISAERFALLDATYHFPLDSRRRWSLTASVSTAWVEYLSGLRQPGNWHTGVSGGLAYRSLAQDWHIVFGYAYGIDAIRSHGRGANSIGILCQFDLGAFQRARAKVPGPDIPQKSRGIFRLFQ
ncbi:MAG: hypothetical protein AB1705_06435 [Verrucomicrobiota bacterium]